MHDFVIRNALIMDGSGGEARQCTQGAVGGGRGMSCYDLKGGIGTASRQVGEYALGALVLTNFGSLKDLRIEGRLVGEELKQIEAISSSIERSRVPRSRGEQGSVIVLLAIAAAPRPAAIVRATGLGAAAFFPRASFCIRAAVHWRLSADGCACGVSDAKGPL